MSGAMRLPAVLLVGAGIAGVGVGAGGAALAQLQAPPPPNILQATQCALPLPAVDATLSRERQLEKLQQAIGESLDNYDPGQSADAAGGKLTAGEKAAMLAELLDSVGASGQATGAQGGAETAGQEGQVGGDEAPATAEEAAQAGQSGQAENTAQPQVGETPPANQNPQAEQNATGEQSGQTAENAANAQAGLPGVAGAPPPGAIPNVDDPSLTREEKVAILDAALLEALKQPGPQIAAPAESGGGTDSVAVGDMQGDSTPGEDAPAAPPQQPVPQPAAETPQQDDSEAESESAGGNIPIVEIGDDNPLPEAGPDNGKLPDDIPAADGDDIIARQFREAAIEETDPVAKAKLWNEYRKYKGLPVRPVPGE